MTEKWLLDDLKKLTQQRHRAVLLDPAGQCSFMLPLLEENQYHVLKTNGSLSERWQREQEELLLRYDAETTFKGKPVVFYATRPQEKLSFLYDYCFTHGCLDLTHPQIWLKKKIFDHTGLQVPLDNPMLLTAAKLGIGKDLAWWKKIVQNLEEVISLDEELLPFLHDPEGYMQTKDADVRRLFEERLHELLEQPYGAKPAATLAQEVVKRLLDGLANNEITDLLLALYHKWADSATYRPSLEAYIRNYKVSATANPWAAYPDHCFVQLDRLALTQITENIRDKAFVADKLQKLRTRIQSKAKLFVPEWWQDVWILFHADLQPLDHCRTFSDFITYYTKTFSGVDRAIRNLYEVFLNEGRIIRPLQEHYEGLNDILLQTWFGFYADYKPDQQGFLPALFAKAKAKTAVIVGDGVRYEIADYVASVLQKEFQVEKQVMLADMPSETEHNMSALYVGNDKVLALHKEREAALTKATGKPIEYMGLEQVHYGATADYLLLTYNDIDSAGEKMQMAAIKLFSEFESVLIEKIRLLLQMGYDVHLVTDHGFVLTGLLEEADKIDPNATGKKDVHERFLRTKDKQTNPDWLAFEEPYEDYNYVYAAKNHRPFKSKGVYGFSHGGFTPQEIILPKFRFSKAKAQTAQLEVTIINKADLKDVPSDLFVIRLEGLQTSADLFGSVRKVQIKLYAGGKEYGSSDIFSIDAQVKVDKEFSFSGNTQVQAVLLDAATQEQLDTAIIQKSNLRDLGGLL